MKYYELTYLITPDLTEDQTREFQNKVASLIQQEGGILIGENLILRKKLAYPVKRKTQAFLAVLNFQLGPERLSNLEKKLKEENNLLRYLILTKREISYPKPKRMMPKRLPRRPEEKKVELKEIEKKLEEILKE